MSLDAIPAGARVLIDANILICAKGAMSRQSRKLLERCAQREVTGVLTTSVTAEYCHRRMRQEVQSRTIDGTSPAKTLAQKSVLLRQLTKYCQEMEDLFMGELLVLAVEKKDLEKAFELQKGRGLPTQIAVNIAVGLRNGVTLFATTAEQYDMIPGLTVFKPNDL